MSTAVSNSTSRPNSFVSGAASQNQGVARPGLSKTTVSSGNTSIGSPRLTVKNNPKSSSNGDLLSTLKSMAERNGVSNGVLRDTGYVGIVKLPSHIQEKFKNLTTADFARNLPKIPWDKINTWRDRADKVVSVASDSIEYLKTYKAERDRGSKLYPRTMMYSATNVLKATATAVAAPIVASGVFGATTAAVAAIGATGAAATAAPVIITGAAVLATGWAINRGVNTFTDWFNATAPVL